MEKQKGDKTAIIISNAVGMAGGILLGVAGTMVVGRYVKNRGSIKNKAKKAFKAIGNTVSM